MIFDIIWQKLCEKDVLPLDKIIKEKLPAHNQMNVSVTSLMKNILLFGSMKN